MTREEFLNMDSHDLKDWINENWLGKGKSMKSFYSTFGIGKPTIKDRMTKINHSFDLKLKKYIPDNVGEVETNQNYINNEPKGVKVEFDQNKNEVTPKLDQSLVVVLNDIKGLLSNIDTNIASQVQQSINVPVTSEKRTIQQQIEIYKGMGSDDKAKNTSISIRPSITKRLQNLYADERFSHYSRQDIMNTLLDIALTEFDH